MTFKLNNVHKAVNWNVEDDDFTQAFWDQNVKQFWLPEEISVSKDVKVWSELSPEERNLYKKVLGGLTLLDTKQANNGIPSMMSLTDNLQRKAVLSFMGTMEEIHAKSYSSIFTTLLTVPEIDEIFEWIESEPTLQKKAEIVLAGQGKMMASGEIISLILRDESLHGKYIGLLAQEIFKDFSKEEQKEYKSKVMDVFDRLMENEINYTNTIYEGTGLADEVINFLKYNANRAMENLGYDNRLEVDPVNPIVLNGLSTETKTHDFFSTKGNGYQKGVYESLQDSDFVFDREI